MPYIAQVAVGKLEKLHVFEGRKKPWGTAHAIMATRNVVDGPFAVINADDYYGPEAFKVMYEYINETEDQPDCYEFAMVAYQLSSTITENGSVARYTEDGGDTWTTLPGDTIVSLNLWGLSRGFMDEAIKGFPAFLDNAKETNRCRGNCAENCRWIIS